MGLDRVSIRFPVGDIANHLLLCVSCLYVSKLHELVLRCISVMILVNHVINIAECACHLSRSSFVVFKPTRLRLKDLTGPVLPRP